MLLLKLREGCYIQTSCINTIEIEFNIVKAPTKIVIEYSDGNELEFTDAEAVEVYHNLNRAGVI